MDDKSPLAIGPLIPFQCEYKTTDGVFGIILYGTSAKQVLEENCAELTDLAVLGVVHKIIPHGPTP